MDDTEVAEIGLEPGYKIDFAIRADFFVRHEVQRVVANDAFEHIVPAGGMATDEAWRMGEWCREFLFDMTFLLGVVNKRIQVVADDFRHTGGGNGDDIRLVQSFGVFKASEHVFLTTKNRRVFGHGIRYASDRFFEVAVKVSPEISHASL